jgi:hypothetical protein
MGPLVVTGTWIELPRYDAAHLRRALARPFDVRDSKQVFHQKDLARGESAALAVIGALCGTVPSSAVELWDLLGAGSGRPALPCSRGPCDVGDLSLPIWGGATGDRSERLRQALEEEGLAGSGIACACVCPWELNRLLEDGTSKLDVDLGLFLEVARRIRTRWGRSGTFTCGKIGNRKSYGSRLGPGHRVIEESREASTYALEELGTMSFVLDADDSDPLVSMSSLVGKYVREIVMQAIHLWAERRVPGLRRPSGYRDPVTRAFVEEMSGTFEREGVPPDCITRSR